MIPRVARPDRAGGGVYADRPVQPAHWQHYSAAIPCSTSSRPRSRNSGDTGRSPGGPAAHRSPVGLAALAILTDIQRHLGARRREHLHVGLVTWARCPDRTAQDADLAEHWIEHARAVLRPNLSGTRGLRGRCPACERTSVSVPDDTGELVHRSALQRREADLARFE